jgi:hypothetical protein
LDHGINPVRPELLRELNERFPCQIAQAEFARAGQAMTGGQGGDVTVFQDGKTVVHRTIRRRPVNKPGIQFAGGNEGRSVGIILTMARR